MGNRAKVLQDSMSRHNVTNPNKLKLVNYNRKICNTEIFKVQNLVGKILTIQHVLVKLFHRQSFALYGISLQMYNVAISLQMYNVAISLQIRGEAIMLVKLSIILFSNSHNFTYYAHKSYLLFSKLCLV